jgi:hypothetical protein
MHLKTTRMAQGAGARLKGGEVAMQTQHQVMKISGGETAKIERYAAARAARLIERPDGGVTSLQRGVRRAESVPAGLRRLRVYEDLACEAFWKAMELW